MDIAFKKQEGVIKILYPNGIELDQYDDMLAIIRRIDKMFRIATQRDALGENSWQDIAGYAILKAVQDERREKDFAT